MKNRRLLKILSVLLPLVMLAALLPSASASACRVYPSGHVFGEWVTDKEPTCSEAGAKHRQCACGVTEKAEIKKTFHVYGSWKTIKEPGCAEEGERLRECRNCGHVQTETVEKTSHSWSGWRVVSEPSAVRAGLREQTCTACGAVRRQTLRPFGAPAKSVRAERTLRHLPEDACSFEIWEESVPMNGRGYYEEGEPVSFGFLITNRLTPEDGTPVMRDVQVFDDMILPSGGDALESFPVIMPGGREGFSADYMITAEDAASGYAVNTAQLYWYEADAEDAAYAALQHMDSNTVYVRTTPPEEDEDVVLELITENTPGNGEYYTEKETVAYCLRLSNNSGETLRNVILMDPLTEEGDGVAASASALKNGKTLEAHVCYTVTAEDVAAGEYVNVAWACWGEDRSVYSAPVTVKTRAEQEARCLRMTGTAFEGMPYEERFDIVLPEEYAGDDTGIPEKRGGNLEETGLASSVLSGENAAIVISGTPVSAGCVSCVYTVEACGVLWEAEIEITVLQAQCSLTIDWGEYKSPETEFAGSYAYGSTEYVLPETSLDGYEFVCWRDGDGSVFTPGRPLTGDTVLHPEYAAAETFTIGFDMSVWAPQPSIRVNKGATSYTLPVPEEKDGYEFDGWIILRSKGNDPSDRFRISIAGFTPGDPITANLILQAQYRQTKGFTVTFDAGEGHRIEGRSERTFSLMTTPEGKLAYYPDAQSDDKKEHFECWYTPDGRRLDSDPDFIFTADVTLVASWSHDVSVSW